LAVNTPTYAQNVTQPDLDVCSGNFCSSSGARCATIADCSEGETCGPIDACNAPRTFCDAEGFKVSLKSFTPAATSTSGKATYVYEICQPAAGTCSLSGASCLDNEQCGTEGGTCRRECAVDKFHDLSHFDVGFPLLADTSCL